ncbi:hypothetical protein [Paenibacillus sedimenti]|uniref:Uncharacterized protein n=1 Tax=Paenibacillus sedimenti TaxID=2770274 RepID=A0A926QMK9_9BACL|nr:hypothetical protein [Paenibacillus sedimenti]MBD0383802.1 hypothetical protein [Paenibacillus sedimenti]
MQDMSALHRGLAIISSCKKETGDIWHAHFGAAGIAGYLLLKENDLPVETSRAITEQLQAMLLKHALSERMESTVHLEVDEAEKRITSALEINIDQLHWVGHNAIYTALSLSAIRELRGWGSEADIEGIYELIRAFDRTIPGRSWLGCTAGDVKRFVIEPGEMPVIEYPEQLSAFVLEELAAFRVIYRAEAHHDLIGHMLTFSHALCLLHDLGYSALFRRGLTPLLQLVKALRRSQNLHPESASELRLVSPVDRLPLVQAEPSPWLPLEQEFWERDHSLHDWDFGHQFKFTCSYYYHLRRVPRLHEATIDRFRCIINF